MARLELLVHLVYEQTFRLSSHFFMSPILLGCRPLSGGVLDFGTWLAERRRVAGLTMRELARRSGLSAPYIAALERSTSEPPPLKTCKALARGLGIDWEDVWQRSFVIRLKTWLKRQGHSGVSDDVLLQIVKTIQSARR